MELVTLIIANIIPLYILVGLGFIAGKWFDVNLHSMAIIAIYFLTPIVNFGAMAKMDFAPEYVMLPCIVFIVSTTIGTFAYKSAQALWKDSHANLIGMGSVNGNSMYFGLPVILSLLGPEWVGVYALMNLGGFLNEIGLGYFFGARSQASVKGALIKVFKLPVIPAIILGLIYNFAGFELPQSFLNYWNYSIGAWVFIGMMLIGVALSKQPRLEIDIKLLANFIATKFILWPIMAISIVLADLHIFKIFSPEIHQMGLVLSAIPLAGNLVAYASTLKLHPEKAAACVLLTTIIAFFTVPGIIGLYTILSP